MAESSIEVLKKVRDAGLTEELTENPVETLKKVGVDPDGYKIHQTKAADGTTHGVCGSVGCVGCVSIG